MKKLNETLQIQEEVLSLISKLNFKHKNNSLTLYEAESLRLLKEIKGYLNP